MNSQQAGEELVKYLKEARVKKPFAVGDRVAVYDRTGRSVGKVIESGIRVLVNFDSDNGTSVVHPKQCRRLVKKAKTVYYTIKLQSQTDLTGSYLYSSYERAKRMIDQSPNYFSSEVVELVERSTVRERRTTKKGSE